MGCGASAASSYRVEETVVTDVKKIDTGELKQTTSDVPTQSNWRVDGSDSAANGTPSSSSSTREASSRWQQELCNNAGACEKKMISAGEGCSGSGTDYIDSSVSRNEHEDFTRQESSGSEDAEAHQKKVQSYLERKEQRKARRKKKGESTGVEKQGSPFLSKHGFLSNVPELDADIQYRFTFIVVGEFAEKVVEFACNSPESCDLRAGRLGPLIDADETPSPLWRTEGSMDSEVAESPMSSNSSSQPSFQIGPCAQGATLEQDNLKKSARRRTSKLLESNRCLCPVPYPWGTLTTGEARKYAKLIFFPVGFGQHVPVVKSTLEASSTALIFVIWVDPVPPAPSLIEQLQSMLDTVEQRRKAPRDLRPVWAVILCQSASEGRCQEGWEPWSADIEEFEQLNGSLWRFGSIQLQDADRLYSTFAKIAAQRIYTKQNPEGDPFSSEASKDADEPARTNSDDDAPPMYGAERDEDPAPMYGAEMDEDA